MRKLLALLCFFISISTRVDAQNSVNTNGSDFPDISDWVLFSGSNISVNVSDSVNYYLGFDLTFQNPENPTEFVRQVRILIPFVVVKSKASLDRNYADAAVAYVTDGTEKALLKEYLIKSDVILYVRWQVEPDIKRGTEKLVRENEVWFLNTTGQWVYGRNIIIDKMMTSETFLEFGKYPIIVGLKYSLSRKTYNSIEVPHEFIIIALKATKGGK